jgi:hypothetical protein
MIIVHILDEQQQGAHAMPHNSRALASQRGAAEVVEQAFATMVPWAREQFGLSAKWQPTLRTFWDPRIRKSLGGWFEVKSHGKRVDALLAVSINLTHHIYPFGTFNEYAHYADDPVIGSFQGTWQQQLWALVAHELAHVVEFATCGTGLVDNHNQEWLFMQAREHRSRFQWIYAAFRRQWINREFWNPANAQAGSIAKELPALPVEAAPQRTIGTIRVFHGTWATGGVASGKFEAVARHSDGFDVKCSTGTRRLLVAERDWVQV